MTPLKPALVAALLAATAALPGCGSSSLTTGSLFGGSDKPKEPPAPRNDLVARAFQVGAVSARAQKCGFNFDPARLKANFLAAEAKLGAPPDELAKGDKLYSTTQNTVAKAIAGSGDYCSDDRVAYIRGDLTRHLAGDYTPGRPRSFAKDDGILSFGGDRESDDAGPLAKATTDIR